MTGARPAAARSPWSMVGAAAAVGAPVVMWGEFLYWGSATPGYNLLLRAASDLGMVGAAHRLEFTVGFFYAAGVLTLVVAAALWRLLPRGWASRAAVLLVALEGGALIATGLLPEHPGSPARTADHQFAASISFAAAAAAPFLLGLAVRNRLPRLGRISLWLGAGLAALFAADYLRRTATRLPDGLFQRPFGLLLTGWFLLMAAAARRLGARDASGDGRG